MPEKAEKIFAWLDGNRTVEGDTAIGTDIYFGAFIRNTTLAAKDSWWDYLGGTLPAFRKRRLGTVTIKTAVIPFRPPITILWHATRPAARKKPPNT